MSALNGFADRRAAFERYLSATLPRSSASPRRLHEAMRWSALSPGKRLRPMLVLSACEACGGAWPRALPAAAAVELVHAFSLVHDDLPCMDDDDYRRGRATTHKKYGEAVAVLAGDSLLALAFEELTRLRATGVPPASVGQAVTTLARASGSRGLMGGQTLDLAAEGRRVGGHGVRDIHVRKTASLISAALELGAIVAGASAPVLRALSRLGRDLGLAFQIHDDLLNRVSTPARLGKPAGTDAARRKATYPGEVGDERASRDVTRLYLGVLERVRAMGPNASRLGLLILATAERER